MSPPNIRNFVIIAHVDHGKSTLADRFLELTRTVEKRKMHAQFLDMHPLEREKGITIKMAPVRMTYHLPPDYTEVPNHPFGEIDVLGLSKNKFRISDKSSTLKVPNDGKLEIEDWKLSGSEFILNLIDTPGHVDFSYEVSRALVAVEGAILLVDATQGIQAQTIANLQQAQKEELTIIPVINKIDLPSADILAVEKEIQELCQVSSGEVFKVSAKTGIGVALLLKVIIAKIPPPFLRDEETKLKALVFDSQYDAYLGVIAHIRVMSGTIKKHERIRFIATGIEAEVLEVGVFIPQRSSVAGILAGEIGYIATGIKEPEKVRVGDTITTVHDKDTIEPLEGYQEPMPMVFASIFPENQDEYGLLRESLKKLKLNDASLSFEPEESTALGRGYRTGFLGMLHMEIVAERLRREYRLNLIFTNPSVAFKVHFVGAGSNDDFQKKNKKEEMIYSASRMPRANEIDYIEEAWADGDIITPSRFFGPLTTLVNERGGRIGDTVTIGENRLRVRFEAPLREVIIDFYDRLKNISKGLASMSYTLSGFRRADLVRLDILVSGERQEAFSEVVARDKVYFLARERVEKLKGLMPRELFTIVLQAEVEGRIIARETISALRKDVTGYLYGGDRTRKMKLWKKQQKGKKRLKETGRVDIPPDIFLKMLKR